MPCRMKGKAFTLMKKVITRGRLDKVVSKAAFCPPSPTYEFVKPRRNSDTNLRLKNNRDLTEVLEQRHLRAHGVFVSTPTQGRIPVVILSHKGKKLRECLKIILFTHGSAADVGSSLNTAHRVLSRVFEDDDDSAVVLWDYPGYGLSTNRVASEKGMREGILSVHEYLTSTLKVGAEKIVALGRSLGTVPTTYLASKWRTHPVNSIVLISPIASAYHVFADVSPEVIEEDPIGAMSNLTMLKKKGCPWPVVVFHGEEDRFIPIEHGKAIVNLLRKEVDDEVTNWASKVAINSFEARTTGGALVVNHQDVLWPSLSCSGLLSHEAFHGSDDHESSPYDKHVLYKERLAFCSVPGAGHNDIMKSDLVYDTLKATITTITAA